MELEKQTMAEVFKKTFDRWGYKNGKTKLPLFFFQVWKWCDTRITYPYGYDDSDPTQKWTFADGSAVLIKNPHEEKNEGMSVYVVNW